MTDFDPGDDWTQVTVEDIIGDPNREYLKRVSQDGEERFWVCDHSSVPEISFQTSREEEQYLRGCRETARIMVEAARRGLSIDKIASDLGVES